MDVRKRDVSLEKGVRVCVVGKVFNPNPQKVFALNRTLQEYHELIKWYLTLDSTSKRFLHENGYQKAKRLFNLNTALIQTARNKAVETLKSFRKNGKRNSVLNPKRISIRFDCRTYNFHKTTNVLTPYWLSLSLSERGRTPLPIVFGEKQRQRIDEALNGYWKFATVEMVKRDQVWYAHFILTKTVEIDVDEQAKTIIGIDRGERNLAVAVAISKNSPAKPMKGRFWRGSEIKRTKGLYCHIRRSLGKKKLSKKINEMRNREQRRNKQQLHTTVNQIIEHVKQFPNPPIVMETLTGIRSNFNASRKLNRRFHSLPFRKLQTIIEYKAHLEGIAIRYLTRSQTRYTSKECHKCGHVARIRNRRELHCSNCGLRYNRDLNACVNIARRIMSSVGWGSRDTPELSNEANSKRISRTREAHTLQGWEHVTLRKL